MADGAARVARLRPPAGRALSPRSRSSIASPRSSAGHARGRLHHSRRPGRVPGEPRRRGRGPAGGVDRDGARRVSGAVRWPHSPARRGSTRRAPGRDARPRRRHRGLRRRVDLVRRRAPASTAGSCWSCSTASGRCSTSSEFDDPGGAGRRLRGAHRRRRAAPGRFRGVRAAAAGRRRARAGQSASTPRCAVPAAAPFFADHFPRRPVFPATLMLDAAAAARRGGSPRRPRRGAGAARAHHQREGAVVHAAGCDAEAVRGATSRARRRRTVVVKVGAPSKAREGRPSPPRG